MKRNRTERFAIIGLLITLLLLVLFHFLIFVGIIPYQIVWGGRIKNNSQMITFEAVSLVMNLFMLAIVAVRGGILKIRLSETVLRIALGVMCALFIFNTIGNALSTNPIEKNFFTPLTIILAMFCFRLAIRNDKA